MTPTSGRIEVGGHDVVADYRAARSLIGLVPQEINLEPFETVINTVRFSRGLFGKAARTTPTSRACCASSASGTSATAR